MTDDRKKSFCRNVKAAGTITLMYQHHTYPHFEIFEARPDKETVDPSFYKGRSRRQAPLTQLGGFYTKTHEPPIPSYPSTTTSRGSWDLIRNRGSIKIAEFKRSKPAIHGHFKFFFPINVAIQLILVIALTMMHLGLVSGSIAPTSTDHMNSVSLYNNSNKADNSSQLCKHCGEREYMRQMRIASIKQLILRKLGLERPPNVTSKQLPAIPSLTNLVQGLKNPWQDITSTSTTTSDDLDEDSSDPESTVVMKKLLIFSKNDMPKKRRSISEKPKGVLYFQLDQAVYSNAVVEARLWVYVKPSTTEARARCRHHKPRLNVFQILAPSGGYNNFDFDSPYTTRDIHGQPLKGVGNGEWVSIDVDDLVQSWINSPQSNMGIIVTGKDCLGHDIIITNPKGNDEESYRPLLDLKLKPKRANRKRRSLNIDCKENVPEKRCCRYPLTINFADFGWDFIVAPKQAEINYCYGECPMLFIPYSPHTYLFQLATSLGACCSPSKTSAMSILYFREDNSIMYGIIGGMIIDQCACF